MPRGRVRSGLEVRPVPHPPNIACFILRPKSWSPGKADIQRLTLPRLHGPLSGLNERWNAFLTGRALRRASKPSTIKERLGDVQARVVLCGHSHQQHLIQLPDGPTDLNPGSVGCPSYDDPGAEPHVSEGG